MVLILIMTYFDFGCCLTMESKVDLVKIVKVILVNLVKI